MLHGHLNRELKHPCHAPSFGATWYNFSVGSIKGYIYIYKTLQCSENNRKIKIQLHNKLLGLLSSVCAKELLSGACTKELLSGTCSKELLSA